MMDTPEEVFQKLMLSNSEAFHIIVEIAKLDEELENSRRLSGISLMMGKKIAEFDRLTNIIGVMAAESSGGDPVELASWVSYNAQRLLRNFSPPVSHYTPKIDDYLSVIVHSFSLIVMPLAAFLGFIHLNPIESSNQFWVIIVFGFIVYSINSVPITNAFSFDPTTGEYVAKYTRNRYTKRRIELSRISMQGLGRGLICYALGGQISVIWNYVELFSAIQGIAGLIGCLVVGKSILGMFDKKIK